MAPRTTSDSTDDPGTAPTDGGATQGVPNHPSTSAAADNEEGEADYGATTLAADIELPRNRRMFLHIYQLWYRSY